MKGVGSKGFRLLYGPLIAIRLSGLPCPRDIAVCADFCFGPTKRALPVPCAGPCNTVPAVHLVTLIRHPLGSSLSRCMCVAFQVFLVTILIQDKGIKNNYSYSAAICEEGEGNCEIAFPLARQRYLHSRSSRPFAYLASFEGAPFQGPNFSPQNRSSHGGHEGSPMEMCGLSPYGQGDRDVLPRPAVNGGKLVWIIHIRKPLRALRDILRIETLGMVGNSGIGHHRRVHDAGSRNLVQGHTRAIMVGKEEEKAKKARKAIRKAKSRIQKAIWARRAWRLCHHRRYHPT